jgi:glycosyltransferase involved in cell wall biosynthesis
VGVTSPKPARPRRVLFVINGLGAGGGESHMVYLAAGLADLGYDVTVAGLRPVRRDIAPLQRAGVRILIFHAEGPAAKLRRLPLLIRLARRADVVCASLFDATLYGRLAAIVARRPVVIIEHAGGRELAASRKGKPRAKWVALHNRLLDPFTHAVVAVAHWQLQILGREGVDESKIHVIHNGVAAEDLRRQADAGGVSRADLGIPDAAKVLIHVARFIPQKNQRATLEVVRRLRTDLGDVHVIFAGEGDLLPEVQAQAEAMGAGAWAHFVGRRRDVPRLLRLADVFVLPSFAEAMPVAILEALAVGIPVVATDVADIRRVLELTGGGLVIPPGDDDAFERACRRLFTEPGLRSRLAREGANGVRLHFDYRPMVRSYATVLDAAAGSAPLDTAA